MSRGKLCQRNTTSAGSLIAIKEQEVICWQRINHFSLLALTMNSELVLVITDEEGAEHNITLGTGQGILKSYQEAATHLLNHIN